MENKVYTYICKWCKTKTNKFTSENLKIITEHIDICFEKNSCY